MTDTQRLSMANVKMEIPDLGRSLKSSILSSTSVQMVKTFLGVVSAAVEQSIGVRPTWLLGETGNSALDVDTRIPPNQRKKNTHTKAGTVIRGITKSKRTSYSIISIGVQHMALKDIACL